MGLLLATDSFSGTLLLILAPNCSLLACTGLLEPRFSNMHKVRLFCFIFFFVYQRIFAGWTPHTRTHSAVFVYACYMLQHLKIVRGCENAKGPNRSIANEPVMVIPLHPRDLVVVMQSGNFTEGLRMARGRIERVMCKCRS